MVPREYLAMHREDECLKERICCPFKACGCSTRLLRENMAQHLADSTAAHATLSCDRIKALEGRVAKAETETLAARSSVTRLESRLEDKLKSLEGRLDEQRDVTIRTLIFKIKGFAAKARIGSTLYSHEICMPGTGFSSSDRGVTLRVSVEFTGELQKLAFFFTMCVVKRLTRLVVPRLL